MNLQRYGCKNSVNYQNQSEYPKDGHIFHHPISSNDFIILRFHRNSSFIERRRHLILLSQNLDPKHLHLYHLRHHLEVHIVSLCYIYEHSNREHGT